MDLGEEHVVLVDAGVAGEYLPELLDVGRLVDADADAYLSRLLRRVEDVDEEAHLALALGHRHRNAEEGVERVGLLLAARAGQARPELRLEHLVHERVVAAYVVLQRLSGHALRTRERILQQKRWNLLLAIFFPLIWMWTFL